MKNSALLNFILPIFSAMVVERPAAAQCIIKLYDMAF